MEHADEWPEDELGGKTGPAALGKRILEGFLAAVVVAFSLVTLVPWAPRELSSSIDYSWGVVLHRAFAEGWQFGSDIMMTYGPWGFLAYGFDPETRLVSLAVWIGLVVLYALAIWSMILGETPLVVAILLAPLVLILTGGGGVEVFFFAMVALYLALSRLASSRARIFMVHALAFAMALAGLVKFSHFALGLASVVCVAIAARGRSRAVQWSAATWAAGVVVWWLAARQSLAGLPAFFRFSFELSSGYSEAMTVIPGPADDSPWAFLASVFLFLMGMWFLAARKKTEERLTLGVGWLIIAFFIFKSGFVRSDRLHTAIAWGSLMISQVIFIIGSFRDAGRPRNRAGWLGFMALPLVISVVMVSSYTPLGLPLLIADYVRETPDRTHLVLDGSLGPGLEARRNQRMEKLVEEHPLPVMSGSVDIYPFLAALPIAAHLRYEPRPVFQSYMTYTPGLAEANAESLRTNGPDQVLFEILPIDDRFPTTEDSLVWLELMARYAPGERAGEFLILDRLDRPRRVSLEPLARSTERIGFPEPAGVPVANLLWARIDIRPTMAGRLHTILHGQPPILLECIDSNGKRTVHRLTTSIARNGFLLSPLVTGADDLRELLDSAGHGRAPDLPTPVAIRIGVASARGRLLFDPLVTIAYDRVIVEPDSDREEPPAE